MSTAQFLNDRAKAQLNGPWRSGPRVTSHDLQNGLGAVERVTAEEWFRAAGIGKKIGNPPAGQSPKSAAQQRVAPVMHFGKHKGKLMSEVRDSDPGYWGWLIREVDGFEAKAKKAGLA